MKSAFIGSKDGFLNSGAVEITAGLSLLEAAVAHVDAARVAGTAITISDGSAKVLARCVVLPGELAAQAGQLALSSGLLTTSAVAVELELLSDDPGLGAALFYAAARRARGMERIS